MKFTLESPTTVTIRSVSEREIRIADERWTETIAVTAAGVLDGWAATALDELTGDDFAPLLATGPEVVVLGTGSTHVLPSRELMFAFARQGIGFEVMDTRAAARTFNVLVSEGRKVAALLYL